MFRPMFVPPRYNPLLAGVCGSLLPYLAQLIGNIREVSISPADLHRLKALGEGPAILSPNHPTGNDPIVLMWLSRMLREPFLYLAAREVFEGPRGWVINRLGAYSVIRGVPDRESLRATRRLLVEQGRKIVIFPEGEIYEHNDTLLAFQSGVAQIGFWALDDLQRAGRNRPLPLVPIAVKYCCCEAPRPAIENGLRTLEEALDLPPALKLSAYQRLLRVGDRVLGSLERQEGVKPPEGQDLSSRIGAVRQKVLDRIAQTIGSRVDRRQPPADQLHLLFHELKSWVGLLPEDFNEYDERLYRQKMAVAAPLFQDLHRLQNFIAVTGDYVAAEATAERFLDVLGRLEMEVLGAVKHPVPRQARVRIAPALRLDQRYEEYRDRRREVVAEVTRELEASIRTMLREMSREATPMAMEY